MQFLYKHQQYLYRLSIRKLCIFLQIPMTNQPNKFKCTLRVHYTIFSDPEHRLLNNIESDRLLILHVPANLRISELRPFFIVVIQNIEGLDISIPTTKRSSVSPRVGYNNNIS